MYRAHGQITDRLLADPTLDASGWTPPRSAKPTPRTAVRAGYRLGGRTLRQKVRRQVDDARWVCHNTRLGRIALRVLWAGLAVATGGLVQLTREVRRNGPHLGARPAQRRRWDVRLDGPALVLVVVVGVLFGGELTGWSL